MLFEGMTRRFGFGPAVTISIIIHGLLALGFGFWLAYTKVEVVHQVVASFLEPLKQEEPKPREIAIKPEVLPQIPQPPAMVSAPILAAATTAREGGMGGAPRTIGSSRGIGGAVGLGKFAVESHVGLGYTGRYRGGISTQTVNVPGPILGTDKVSPGVVTDPTVTTPGDLTYTGPAGSGTGVGGGRGFGEGGGSGAGIGVGRGLVGVQAKVARGMETKIEGLQGLAMVGTVSAQETGLGDMPNLVSVGNYLIPPIPPNQLGAAIATDPDTGEPTGYFQMCYVLFRERNANPLFRIDPTALSFLLKWMSVNTKIRGSLAGRVLPLDDPGILEAPMLYMNGVRAIRLSDREKNNLYRYLVERGGFIFVDDDNNGPGLSRRVFAISMRAQLGEILRKATGRQVRYISYIHPDHPIWNRPFKLNGQPASPQLWLDRETYPMNGYEIDGRLAVVISYNDYNNGWEAPGRGLGVDYVVPVLRMGVNFIFYAATHGKISDYKHYIPPKEEQIELYPGRVPEVILNPPALD